MLVDTLAYYLESFLIAITVLSSSVRAISSDETSSSTRDLSYHMATRDAISVTSVVFFIEPTLVVCFLVRSIDPLRSTIIFWAVFFPIPGTLERSVSSSNCIARRSSSSPSQRSASAVFPPIPFTFNSWRNILRSAGEVKPKSVCPTSVI